MLALNNIQITNDKYFFAKLAKEKKKKRTKIIRIGNKEKVLLAKALRENNQYKNLFESNYNNIICKVEQNITVNTYKDAVSVLDKINISDFFGLNKENGKNFQCSIIKDNIASINCNKRTGKYKYFTKNRNNGITYFLNIINLYELVFNVNYYKAITDLCKITKINIKEGQWRMSQLEIFTNNIIAIENASEEMKYRHPSLYKYIKNYLPLLEKFNCLAIANVRTLKETVNNDLVFFASVRYLQEYFNNEKDASTINRTINMFAALGLVKKVHISKLPKELKQNALKNKQKDKHAVTFYQIPELTTDLLIEAEKRVMKLNKNKITAANISTFNIKEVLGVRIFNSVFSDTVAKTSKIYNVKQENKLYIVKKDDEDDEDFPF